MLLPGESGLGKSTLINSLFLTDLYPGRQVPNANGKPTVLAKSVVYVIKRNRSLLDWLQLALIIFFIDLQSELRRLFA